MNTLKIAFVLLFFSFQSNLIFSQSCQSYLDDGYKFNKIASNYIDNGNLARANAEAEAKKSSPNSNYICKEIDQLIWNLGEAKSFFLKSLNSYNKAYLNCTSKDSESIQERKDLMRRNIQIQNEALEEWRNIYNDQCE